MADRFSNSFADNYRLARSRQITLADDAGTYNIIRVPRYAFITAAWLQITGAMHANTLIDVGIIMGSTTDADALIDQTEATPETAVIEMFTNAYWFSSGPGVITTTLSWNSETPAGGYRVWVQYSIIA